MKQTTYKVTRVYSAAHGTTQLPNSSVRVESDRDFWEAASIVIASGMESTTSGSNSTVVTPNKIEGKGVSQVTFPNACYIVEVCK